MTTEETKGIEKKEERSEFALANALKKTTETIKDKASTYNEKYVKKTTETIKDKASTYNENYVKKAIEKGKEMRKGIENDVRKAMDRIVEAGKKASEKYPLIGKIETRVKEQWEKMDKTAREKLASLTAHANLPNKSDIEKLTAAMEALSRKVDIIAEKGTMSNAG